jgi:hypothetical protein
MVMVVIGIVEEHLVRMAAGHTSMISVASWGWCVAIPFEFFVSQDRMMKPCTRLSTILLLNLLKSPILLTKILSVPPQMKVDSWREGLSRLVIQVMW